MMSMNFIFIEMNFIFIEKKTTFLTHTSKLQFRLHGYIKKLKSTYCETDSQGLFQVFCSLEEYDLVHQNHGSPVLSSNPI